MTKQNNIILKIGLILSILFGAVTNAGIAHAEDLPGLKAFLANWVPQPGGFTVILVNYDPSYQWTFTAATGQAYFDGNHQITVTGAFAGFSNNLTVTTSKSGYTTVKSVITGDVMGLPWNYAPNIVLSSQSAGGFTAQITNYDPAVIWQWSSTAGDVTLSSTGLLTVWNLKRGQSATITINMSKLGYITLQANYTQTSQPPPLNLIPSIGKLTPSSQSVTVPVTNFDSYFDWAVKSSTGNATIDKNTGVITISGLTATQVARVNVSDLHNGQLIGQTDFYAYTNPAALNLKPAFSEPEINLMSVKFQVANYDSLFNWSVNSSLGVATIDNSGLVTVTNLQPGQNVNVNVISQLQGQNATTASINVSTWPTKGLNLQTNDPNQVGDGFSFQISDYNPFYSYQVQVDGGQISMSSGGLVTVSGLTPGQKAIVTLSISKGIQQLNSAQVTSASLLEVNIAPITPVASTKPAAAGSSQKKKTISPPAKQVKTIICLKGNSHRFVTAASPKCPTGYKLQK